MKPCVLTIGNFDGVHLGHQKLIAVAANKAQSLGIIARLMTFEPHPMQILAPQLGLKCIFSLSDRVKTAQSFGINEVIVLPFSRDISELMPNEFFDTYILKKFNAQFLVIGHDFSFGKNRTGTNEVLRNLCEKNQIGLHIEEPLKISNTVVSSSQIREFIIQGKMEKAKEFLGREFYLEGLIEKGDGRGKKIGFPTANLFTKTELFPKKGVYVTSCELKGRKLKSATNVGENPTFIETKNAILKVETHILDFDEDIYGEKMRVNFLSYLREEKKFGDVNSLVEQIKTDVGESRKYPWKKY